MKTRYALTLLSFVWLVFSCQPKTTETLIQGNPPEEGFDLAHSDPAAIQLADSIMVAVGGRQAWENTHFISWNADGWNITLDKKQSRARIESTEQEAIYLLNLTTGEGKAREKGREITTADSLQNKLDQAREIFDKSTIGLLLPFKLKTKGTTLEYMGEDSVASGEKCNVLKLSVDRHADNQTLLMHVDLKDNLIEQVSYLRNDPSDSTAVIVSWDNYKKYGDIFLSADRTDGKGPKNVKVDEELSDNIFSDF